MDADPVPAPPPRPPTRAPLPAVVYEREPGAAARPLAGGYRRREPEKTALYAVVRDHLETFLQEGRDAHPDGTGYPLFIEQEFRKYLSCGMLSRGFARVRCPACGEERLVGFSCKSRICPSCWSRRAADLAADLVDRVLPDVAYRQYVLTFPWEIRYALSMNRTFFSRMLHVFVHTLFAWQRQRARRLGVREGQTGAVLFVHRFTQSLSLFPHAHALLPDGLLVPGADGTWTFARLPEPTDEELGRLTARIVRRLTAVAREHLPEPDPDAAPDEPAATGDQALVQACVAEALRSPAGPGPGPRPAAAPTARRLLCTQLDGFSLHAATTVEEGNRPALERLARYGLRPPFSVERFSLAPDGRVRYELRKPGPGGSSEVFFQPTALLRRLAAILPAPRARLVKYYGVFANRSRWRPALLRARAAAASPPAVAPATAADAETPTAKPRPLPPPPRRRRTPWAELLRRVLDVDALTCPACATPMVVLAFLTDPRVVARILAHLGLPTAPPPLARARDPFDDTPLDLGPEEPPETFPDPDHRGTAPAPPPGRAPPSSGAREPR